MSKLRVYRPPYLRKAYVREVYPVSGARGAAHIIRRLGFPAAFGLPSEAVGFRDETGKLRSICAYYPDAGWIMDLRINKHVSSLWHYRAASPTEHDRGMPFPVNLAGKLNWNARNVRGEGL